MGVGGGALTVGAWTLGVKGASRARPSARWGRVFAFPAAPNFVFIPAECGGGVKDAWPAWRAACPTEREGGISRQRDRRARLSGHKTVLSLVPPAPGVLRAGAGAVPAAL